MELMSKKGPATDSSRARISGNPVSRFFHWLSRLKNLDVPVKAQQPVIVDRISNQLETLIDLHRLQLLTSLEDKQELRDYMDEAAKTFDVDLNAKQRVFLLQTLVDQRRKRLKDEPIVLKDSDFKTF